MIVSLYSYRDRKVGAYGFPFKSEALEENVIESVARTVMLGKFPDAADYELYRVGTFDDHTCEFVLEKKPVMIADLASFIPVKKEENPNA